MAQLKVQGNASGTGVFTVTSPNSNNTQTLTLPDATATLVGDTATQTLSNKTISGNLNMTGGTKYQVGGVTTNALAWVNFNGTTSPGTIRAQYNVSSVTKNGTGDYTVNFTNALADANYSVLGAGNGSYDVTVAVPVIYSSTGPSGTPATMTSSAVRMSYRFDAVQCCVAIFGN